MGTAYISQNTDSRFNHALQGPHLPHFGDTGFENTQFGFFIQLPDGQGNADLRIITAGRTDNAAVRTQ